MTITIIAAMDKNGAIGKDGKLPWHIPSELKHFKDTTMGHTVIMGNTTSESLKHGVLEGRINIIYSRGFQNKQQSEMLHFRNNFNDDIKLFKVLRYKPNESLFIIGGASIFKQALPFADKMILSRIDTEVEGADAFFPEWSEDDWSLRGAKSCSNEGEPQYMITIWERRKCLNN